MAYTINADGKLVQETNKNYLSLSSSKRELFNALVEQVNRAEAAEARAADLLETNRKQAEEIETVRAERNAINAYAVAENERAKNAESERDTAWTELRVIRNIIGADDNEATSDEVARKFNALRAQLEHAHTDLAEYRNEVERLTHKVMSQ